MKPTLVVLAAGMGSRYGGVKQMDGFGPNGQWLLEYSVFDAINAGFKKIVFILRNEIIDDFKTYFESRLPKDIEREYVLQNIDDIPAPYTVPEGRVKPWGTSQAVLSTKKVVTDNFAVINADDFYGPEAYQFLVDFLQQANPSAYDFGMVGYLLCNTLSNNGSVSRGLCKVNEDMFLEKVEEHTKIYRTHDAVINEGEGSQKILDEQSIVSMNCWAFTPKIFNRLEDLFAQFLSKKGSEQKSEYYIPTTVQELKEQENASIKVIPTDGEWFGVTYSADKETVENNLAQMHQDGIYPDNLWDESQI